MNLSWSTPNLPTSCVITLSKYSYYLFQVCVITLSLCSYYLFQVYVITLPMYFMISISLLYSCIRPPLRPINRPISIRINTVIYNYIHLDLDTFTRSMPTAKRNWCPHPRHLEKRPDGRKMFTKNGPKPNHPVGSRRISSTFADYINQTCSAIQNNPSLKLNGTNSLCTTCYKQEFRRFQCINEEKLCTNLERVKINDCLNENWKEVEDSPNLIDVKQDYSIDKRNEVLKMFDLEPVIL